MRGSIGWAARAVASAAVLLASPAGAQPAPPSPATPPAPRSTMTAPATSLADAVTQALRQNPDVLTMDAQVRGAEADRSAGRGALLPRLHLDANVQQWDSPFAVAFSLPGASSVKAPPFQVRDQFTWAVSPSIVQPLTGLWAIYDQYKVRDYGVDVAGIKRRATRREIAFQVAQGYYRLLEAQRLAEVADASVTRLEAQLKTAKAMLDNGVIGKNDFLRAQLALAGARQRTIQTRGSVTLLRGQLDTTLGNSPDTPFEPVPFTAEPPPMADLSIDAAERRGTTQRLELRVIELSIAQAERAKSAESNKYTPQVNAIASYTHLGGQPFQPENSAYVGLFASWDVWDWGVTGGAIDAANAKLDEARIAQHKVADQVRLEARDAYVNADTARQALDVARAAVDQAEENYRIVTKKFDANAATSFDVVDAESLLTEAHGQVEGALYDYLIARAALDRATGTPLPGER